SPGPFSLFAAYLLICGCERIESGTNCNADSTRTSEIIMRFNNDLTHTQRKGCEPFGMEIRGHTGNRTRTNRHSNPTSQTEFCRRPAPIEKISRNSPLNRHESGSSVTEKR